MKRLSSVILTMLMLLSLTACSNSIQSEARIVPPDTYTSLREDDAILYVQGKPDSQRTLYVFSKPDCGFCRRLNDEVRKLRNIRVLNFLIAAGSNPKSSVDAWCSYRKSLGQACNEDALDRNTAIARQLQVRGTPTIIFPDRKMIPGYMNAGQIERHLRGEP